jgi:uncharacterized repeat protein (TIGR01451 family)
MALEKTVQVAKDGNLVYFKVTVTNTGAATNKDVIVTFTLPTGLAYKTYKTTVGSYSHSNAVTQIWTVGTVPVGQSHSITVTYKVTDFGEVPYDVEAVISGLNIDPNDTNNTLILHVEASVCPPSGGAVGDPMACYCGNVFKNSTLCTGGLSEARINVGDFVNIDPDFADDGWDTETGDWNVQGFIINPYLQASFTWNLFCVDGLDELDISGPATVIIPPLFHADATDVLEDNGDGTYTHTSMDGTEVTFNTLGAESIGTATITGATTTLLAGTIKNHHLINDSDGAAKAINLPNPNTLGLASGVTRSFTFKRANAYVNPGSITLVAPGSVKIDGATTFVFPSTDWTSVTLFTNGVDYFIK